MKQMVAFLKTDLKQKCLDDAQLFSDANLSYYTGFGEYCGNFMLQEREKRYIIVLCGPVKIVLLIFTQVSPNREGGN
jgi:hypothetical protein